MSKNEAVNQIPLFFGSNVGLKQFMAIVKSKNTKFAEFKKKLWLLLKLIIQYLQKKAIKSWLKALK